MILCYVKVGASSSSSEEVIDLPPSLEEETETHK